MSDDRQDRPWGVVPTDLPKGPMFPASETGRARLRVVAKRGARVLLRREEPASADETLDAIAALLDGREWDGSDIETVAALVRRSGRTIGSPREDDVVDLPLPSPERSDER